MNECFDAKAQSDEQHVVLDDVPLSKKRTKVVFLNPKEITNWEQLDSNDNQGLIEKSDILQYEKLLNKKSSQKPRSKESEAVSKKRGRPKGSRNRGRKKCADLVEPWLQSDDDDDERDQLVEDELDDEEFFRRLEEEKLREEEQEAIRKNEARLKKKLSRVGKLKLKSQCAGLYTQSQISNDISDLDCQSDNGEGTKSSSLTGSRADFDDLDTPRVLYPHEEVDEEFDEPDWRNPPSPSSTNLSEAEQDCAVEQEISEFQEKKKFRDTLADAYTMEMLSVDPVQLMHEAPPLLIPRSSSDLLCPRPLLLDAISVYEILLRYNRLLRLSPFKVEDFFAALLANENSTLLSEIHICLLKILFHEDDVAGTLMYSADCKDSVGITLYLLDHYTWPHLLASYLLAIQSTEASAQKAAASLGSLSISTAHFSGVAACGSTGGGADSILSASMFPPGTIPLDPRYPFVSIEKRLAVLQGLTNLLLATGSIRADVLRDGFLPHEDHCRCCHQSGDMLCCDGCPAVFHLTCLDPPLSVVPSSSWLCPVCVSQQTPGVTDCTTEDERLGKIHRKEPIGSDRAGRVYWYLGRRIVVEPIDFSKVEPCIPGLMSGRYDHDWLTKHGTELFKTGHWRPLPHYEGSSEEEALSQIGPILRCNPSVDYANEPEVYYYSSLDQVLELRKCLSPRWEPWLCQQLDSLLPRLTMEMKCTETLVSNGFEQYCRTHTAVNRLSVSKPNINLTLKNVFSVFELESASSKSRLEKGSIGPVMECPRVKVSCGFEIGKHTLYYPGRLPSHFSPNDQGLSDDPSCSVGVLVTRDKATCIIRSQDGLNTAVKLSNHSTGQPPPTVLSAAELEALSWVYSDVFVSSESHTLIAYRLSDEGNWRRWTNLYAATNEPDKKQLATSEDQHVVSRNFALSRGQFMEEKERRRLLGNKFCLSDVAVELWNYIDPPMVYRQFVSVADWLKIPCDAIAEQSLLNWNATPSRLLDVLKLTLCYFEAHIPLAMYCPAWRSRRSHWLSAVMNSTNVAELAYLLSCLDSAIRPICFQRIWSSTLGHLSFERTTAAQREDDRRMRQFDRSASGASAGASAVSLNVIRTKTPNPIRHTVWKYRGEEYRRLGGDGWMWLSATRRETYSEVSYLKNIYPPLRELNEQCEARGLQHGIGWGVCQEYLKDQVPVRPPTAGECRGHVLHPITGIPIYLITKRIPYILPADELRRISEEACSETPPDADSEHENKCDTQDKPSSSTDRMEDPECPPVLHVSYCLQERIHFPPVISRPNPTFSSRRLRFRLDDLLARRRAAAEADKHVSQSANAMVVSLESQIKALEAERSKLRTRLDTLEQDVQQARLAKNEAIKAKTSGFVVSTMRVPPRAQPYINVSHTGYRGSYRKHAHQSFPTARSSKRRASDYENDDGDSYDGYGAKSSATPIRRSSRRQRATRHDPDFVVNFDEVDDIADADALSDRDACSSSDSDYAYSDYSNRRIPQYDGAGDEESNDEGVGIATQVNVMKTPALSNISSPVVQPVVVNMSSTFAPIDASTSRTVCRIPPKSEFSTPRLLRIVRPVDSSVLKSALHATNQPMSNGISRDSNVPATSSDNQNHFTATGSVSNNDTIRMVLSGPVNFSQVKLLSTTAANSFVSPIPLSTGQASSAQMIRTVTTASSGLTINRLPSGASLCAGATPLRLILSAAPNPENPNSMMVVTSSMIASNTPTTVSAEPLKTTARPMLIPAQPAILRRTLTSGQTMPSEFKLVAIPSSQSLASSIAASTARQIAQVDVPLHTNQPQGRRTLSKASSIRLIEDRALPHTTAVSIAPRGIRYGNYLSSSTVEAQLALDRAVAESISHLKKVEDELHSVQTELSELDQKLAALHKQLEQQRLLQSRGFSTTAEPYCLGRSLPESAADEVFLPRHLPPVNPYRWPNNQNGKSSLFRLHPDNLRSTILAAGRKEIPGYDVEKKRLAQVQWPYQSSKPCFSECWRFRLSRLRADGGTHDLAALALSMRTLWHCLRWDDMLAEPQEDEYVLDARGHPCFRREHTTNGNVTIRKIVGLQPLDRYWQRANYLVQLTHKRPTAGRSTRSRSKRVVSSTRRRLSELPSAQSPASVSRRRKCDADSDDSDYDPSKDLGGGSVRSSSRRNAGRRYRRSKYNLSDEEDDVDSQTDTQLESRVEEVWLPETDFHLWELRTFMNEYLPPISGYPSLETTDHPRLPYRLPPAFTELSSENTQKINRPVTNGSPHVTIMNSNNRFGGYVGTLDLPFVHRSLAGSTILDKQRNNHVSSPLIRPVEPPRITMKQPAPPPQNVPHSNRAASLTNEPPEFAQLSETKSLARSLAASRAAKASVAARKLKMERTLLEQNVRSLRSQLLARRRIRMALANLDNVRIENENHKQPTPPKTTPDTKSTPPPRTTQLMRGQRKRGRPPLSHKTTDRSFQTKTEDVSLHTQAKLARGGATIHKTVKHSKAPANTTNRRLSSPLSTNDSTGDRHSAPSSRCSTPSTCPAIGDELMERVLIPSPLRSPPSSPPRGALSGRRGSTKRPGQTSSTRGRGAPSGRRGRGGAAGVKREIRPPVSLNLREASTSVAADESTVYCLCKLPYDATREYIGCDLCQDWFHFECVGLVPADAARLGDSWHCPECKKAENRTQDLLYCSCRTPYEATRVYIACDGCDEWYHAECVGMTSEQAATHSGTYLCPTCAKPTSPAKSDQVTESEQTKTINEIALDNQAREKIIELVNSMKAHKMSWALLQPPDSSKYPAAASLKCPKGLMMVSENIVKNMYSTLGDFAFAMNELFTEARSVYPPESPELYCTDVMEAHFIQQMKVLKAQLANSSLDC